MEMRDEVLSSVGAPDMDKSGYQVSNLDDIEIFWEDTDLNMDRVFQTCIQNDFSSSNFFSFEMGSMAKNPSLFDEKQDKE